MIAVAAGLVAGILHVLSGPDHLATVGTLAIEERRRTWATGFVWGVGHTSGVWIAGALVLVLRAFLPLEQMSSWSDYLASFGLVGIGLWGLYKGLAHKIHEHEHEHEHEGKLHAHHHTHRQTDPGAHAHSHTHTHVACGLGILHGLGGTSHYLGILPALAFPSNYHAFIYLGSFGVGTIAAMAGFGWLVGKVASRVAGVGLKAHRLLLVGCSTAAIAIGCVWLVG